MKTANAKLRDQLKAVRTDLSSARDERAAAVGERDEAKEAYNAADIDRAQMLESPEFEAVKDAVEKVGSADDRIADLQLQESQILSVLGEDTPAPDQRTGPTDGAPAPRGWDASRVTNGDHYKRLLESGHITSKAALGSVLLGEVAGREDAHAFFAGNGIVAADVTSEGTVGAQSSDRRGIIPPNLKQLSLLDLIPTGTTDATVIEYVQVLTIPGSAAEWTEGDLKPEQSFVTQDADAPVRTIAGWIKLRRNAMADVAGLTSLINSLLPYDVRRRLEQQILVGDGLGQNLLGLYNTPGIGEPDAVGGDNKADSILRAITVIFLADGDPNFVSLHPLDREELLLMRENEAERTGAYLYGSPASQVAPTIWGLAMTTNRVVPSDQPLVGDSMAAQVAVKEGITVRASDSDGDDFRLNRVTVLAEGRFAFPVWRPSSFAVAAPTGS